MPENSWNAHDVYSQSMDPLAMLSAWKARRRAETENDRSPGALRHGTTTCKMNLSKMNFPFFRRRKKPAEAPDFKPTAINPAATQPSQTRLNDATLIITHAEICNRHGTGALLSKIFERDQALLVFYSRNYFDHQCLGAVTHHLPHPECELEVIEQKVGAHLDGHEVKRIFCVPFYPDEALSAIAAQKLIRVPLVTYIMDDQNLFAQGIADPLMKQLLESSSMRFAISETLRAGYEQKFGKPFWIIPPVNGKRFFAPPGFRAPNNEPPRGVMIGNIWSLEILQQLRELIKVSGLTIEWYGNAGKPFIQLEPAELANEGIILHQNLADDLLVRELRRFDYAIVPSGTLDGTLEHDWLFRASLPSRLIYTLTTAHLPVVVLGDPETAAGKFVTKLELGVASPYRRNEFREAVAEVTNAKTAARIRRKAARLAPTFASEPISDWVWRSVQLGKPLDDRYEKVFKLFRSTPPRVYNLVKSNQNQAAASPANSAILMSESLRHKTTALAQRALAIDALHRKLDFALGRLEALELLPSIINQLATTLEGIAPVVQGGAATIQSLVGTINQLGYTISDVASKLTAIDQRTKMLIELSDNMHARARRTEDELRKLEEHVDGLKLIVKSLEEQFKSFDERFKSFDERSKSLEDQFKSFHERFKSFDERYNQRIAISEPWLPEDSFAHSEPEYYLVAFLYNFLPNRVLLDVGANVGDFAEVVSDSGYRVYSFEPFPPAFERLKRRMTERSNVKTFNLALGSTETTLPLYVASESSEQGQDDPSLYNTFRPHFVRESLSFTETVDVSVRTIESLVKSGEVPKSIDFLKIDTEGFDLEVIKGLGDVLPTVVQTEFWGDEFVFVRNAKSRDNFVSSAEIIREMCDRDYLWRIIVFRGEGEAYVRFAANLGSAPKKAWGNMLFFRDHSLFLEALRWCQGALPRFQSLPADKFGSVQRE